MHSTLPRSSTAAEVSNASWSQTPRWTGNAPMRASQRPQRRVKSSLLPMKRTRRPSATATKNASSCDGWLEARMKPPSGMCSRPEIRTRASSISTGASTTKSRPWSHGRFVRARRW